jgi:hypothetical protein
MPTRRLPDPPASSKDRPCFHPEHNPPGMMVFPPGRYEHECPGCGRKIQFQVAGLHALASPGSLTGIG